MDYGALAKLILEKASYFFFDLARVMEVAIKLCKCMRHKLVSLRVCGA